MAVSANQIEAVAGFRARRCALAIEHDVDEIHETRGQVVDGACLCCEREERVVSVDTIGRDVLQVVEQLKEDAIAEREALLVAGGVTHDEVQVGKYRMTFLDR